MTGSFTPIRKSKQMSTEKLDETFFLLLSGLDGTAERENIGQVGLNLTARETAR